MSIIFGTDDYKWSFNNNYKNRKFERLYFSNFSIFDSGKYSDEILSSPKINVKYSDFVNFSNLGKLKKSLNTDNLKFSKGLFPYYDNINLLIGESTYTDLDSVIGNLGVQGYLFDNSIPSRELILQSKVIASGVHDNFIQMSYRFPAYPINFEHNITNIMTSIPLNTELNFFPKLEDNSELNFATDVIFADNTLNWEWSPGAPLNSALIIEFGKTPDTIYLMNYQYAYMFIENRSLNLEYNYVYKDTYNLNLELNLDEVSRFGKLQLEYLYGQQSIEPINFEAISEFSGHFNYQTLVFAGTSRNLTFEYVPSKITEEHINYEYQTVVIDDYGINVESYTEINTDYIINHEFFVDEVDKRLQFEFKNVYIDAYNLGYEINIPEIWKDYGTNYEFKNVYIDKYSIDFESNVYNIYKSIPINLETLIFANTNYNLNFEVLRFQEKTINTQSYVVPVTYKDNLIQININAFIKQDLNFEMNIPELPGNFITNIESNVEIQVDYINNFETNVPELWKVYDFNLEVNAFEIQKDYGTNYEFKNVYIDEYSIDFESKTVIDSNVNLNLETSITIDKNYELSLEYLAELPFDIGLDFESKTEIEEDIQLEIEYNLDKISKDYNFNIESYIEIEKNYTFNFEAFVNEVSKHLHFEYDILDLVYYVISKGYNILPWCYSDGLGFWDLNSNKNWNKSEDLTTIQTGLINQLSEKGLSIPELIQYSDKNLDAFGIFIPGKSKDINIQSNILYFESENDFTLVLGKKKKEAFEVIQLKKGNNLIVYDGAYKANDIPKFGIIRNQINDEYNYCSIWKQDEGIWRTIKGEENHNLYFTKNIDTQEQPIPYVLVINVSNDCEFTVVR